MSDLADAILPLIRTRAELIRWGPSVAHGDQMHEAIDALEAAIPTTEPGEIYAVTHKALASAIKVIGRADDSSGVIGDACRRLLALHPQVAAAARVPASKLIDWMVKFQFANEVDFFELDPVAYAPALGDHGIDAYRSRLRDIEAGLGPRPEDRWSFEHRHEWFTLDWNAQRLAVLDHDVEAIIKTHARDRLVARWYHDTAVAFEEIGDMDLAIDWAKQATDFDRGHQARNASDYWCRLLDAHRPTQAAGARLLVFRRWPSSTTAARLYRATGTSWPDYRDEVLDTLACSPRDAVLFALLTLKDVKLAWELAHTLALDCGETWSELIKAYEKVDRLAVLPIHQRLAEGELINAGAQHYRTAARRLVKMRKLAAGSAKAGYVDALIADLRDAHRRRPRLRQEFDRAGLP